MKRLGWVVLAALGAASCGDSGQTGSPACGAPQACECAALAGRVLVRGSVLSNDGHQISLRIAEQLNPSGAADAPLFANKVLEGPLSRASTCSPAPGVFAVGDSVFASFVMGDECSVNESECDPNTILAYPWLWPWGDTIAITPSTILTVADAVTLSDRTTCDERFPPPPAPPCDDTVGDEAGSCSLSGVGANRRRPQGALVALIVFAGALRRRRRRARCFRR